MMFVMTETRTIQEAFGSFICAPHATRAIIGIAYKASINLPHNYLNRYNRNQCGPFQRQILMSIGSAGRVYETELVASRMWLIEVLLRAGSGDL